MSKVKTEYKEKHHALKDTRGDKISFEADGRAVMDITKYSLFDGE